MIRVEMQRMLLVRTTIPMKTLMVTMATTMVVLIAMATTHVAADSPRDRTVPIVALDSSNQWADAADGRFNADSADTYISGACFTAK